MKTILVTASLTNYIVTCGNVTHHIHTNNPTDMREIALRLFGLKNAKFKRI